MTELRDDLVNDGEAREKTLVWLHYGGHGLQKKGYTVAVCNG